MAKRILVPLEAPAQAEAVLSLVADLAHAAGATVRLLHVTPYARTRFSADERVIAYGHQQEERDTAHAESWLRDLATRLDGVAAEHRVRLGDAREEILREAEAFGADAIVLATPRRGWWRRALGPVARYVHRKAAAPVLLVSEGAR